MAIFRIDQDNLAQNDNGYIVPGTVNTIAQYAAQGTISEGYEVEVVGQPIEGWNINAGYSQFTAQDANDLDVNTDSPRKQFKLFTTYNLSSLLPELTVGGGINWQGETSLGSDTAKINQDSYALINLMARYQFSEAMNLQLNVNNLTDEKYYSYLSSNGQFRYGDPRNVTANLKYRF